MRVRFVIVSLQYTIIFSLVLTVAVLILISVFLGFVPCSSWLSVAVKRFGSCLSAHS